MNHSIFQKIKQYLFAGALISQQWLQKLPEGGWRILLLNWTDIDNALECDPAAMGIASVPARDFWHDNTIVPENGVFQANLSPRSSLLLEKKDDPAKPTIMTNILFFLPHWLESQKLNSIL